MLIVKKNTKQIAIYIPFKSINSTTTGITKNLKSSEKSKLTPLIQVWTVCKMIIKNLRMFLQNVCKNYLLTKFILENQKEFDILFI